MGGNQYVVRVLLGAAMMLWLVGCAQNNNMDSMTAPTQTATTAAATVQTEPEQTQPSQTEPTETTLPVTEPEETVPPQTEPPETNPPVTEPEEMAPPQTEPPETDPPVTEPEETVPPQTEPVQLPQIQAQPVIDRAAAALADRMPAIQYDPSWSGGTVVRMPVSMNQSEEEMAEELLAGMVALLTEVTEGADPEETITYTYSLSCLGTTEDNGSYLFAVSYTSIGQESAEIDFDSDAVVAQVTQGVLNSTRVTVTAFDGSDYEACVTIRTVPYFYNTQQAVESLIDAVETEIFTENILGAEYCEFCVAYDSEEETCHVFLLYLK